MTKDCCASTRARTNCLVPWFNMPHAVPCWAHIDTVRGFGRGRMGEIERGGWEGGMQMAREGHERVEEGLRPLVLSFHSK